MPFKFCRDKLLQLAIPSLLSGLPLTTVVLAVPPAVASTGVMQVEQGGDTTVALTPGAGTNISFLPTGEIINQVWLDDPSWIVFDANGCLAMGRDASQDCQGPPAQILHLRQIESIALPGLPATAETELTIVTQTAKGTSHIHVFRIVRSDQATSYHTVEIVPAHRAAYADNDINMTAVRLGRDLAAEQRWLQPGDMLYQRIQYFLNIAQTEAVQPAAEEAGISLALVSRLEQLGKHDLLLNPNHPNSDIPNSARPDTDALDSAHSDSDAPATITTSSDAASTDAATTDSNTTEPVSTNAIRAGETLQQRELRNHR